MLFDKRAIMAAAILLATASPAPAAAAANEMSDRPSATLSPMAETVFTTQEKRIICTFFDTPACRRVLEAIDNAPSAEDGKKQKSRKHKDALLPPGLAKRDTLPPGLQKQLERNGKLPHGLEKRALPDELARALPARQAGLERVIVDDDIVLIRRGTDLILDIFENVVGTAR